MLTFFSFLFVALEGFVVTTKFGKLRSSVPLTAYITLVFLYFVVSVINNLALSYNISMPLHMIFKGVKRSSHCQIELK
jgi:UDP-xylose/UDP-N-acetylglucosamine transporter B4